MNCCVEPLVIVGPAGVTAIDCNVAVPVETTKFTADPAFTWDPAVGFSLVTLPGGTVPLDAVVTVPTVSPAF